MCSTSRTAVASVRILHFEAFVSAVDTVMQSFVPLVPATSTQAGQPGTSPKR